MNADQTASAIPDGPLPQGVRGRRRWGRFLDGETILNRFTIVRYLDGGGMGDVYEARDKQLGRIALKTINGVGRYSPEAFARFVREVKLGREVTDRRVCRIYDLCTVPATEEYPETAFITMEYIEGMTLSKKLKSGPLPWREAQAIALDLCEGLRLVHLAGIVHRDLKCSNVMLAKQGSGTRTVLMDFGLAHDLNAAEARRAGEVWEEGAGEALTRAGDTPGTLQYMAPEQLGPGKHPISPATDIYALGLVLYEMVTGERLLKGETRVEIAAEQAKPHQPASAMRAGLPRKWDYVIGRCVAYEPRNRFQSAAEVAEALRRGPADPRNVRRDYPWVARAGYALLACALAWGIFGWWQARQVYRHGAEAMRWYASGVTSMKEGTYLKATRAFQMALSQEPDFVMAHARLAEAWSDLDFQADAQREMLKVSPRRGGLRKVEQLQVEAIRAAVLGDFAKAVQEYQELLLALPQEERAPGYVDLGWAYERNAEPAKALERYEEAVQTDKNDVSALMHLGVLQTRLHHKNEAQAAFGRAEALFTAGVNQEGLAELHYEGGYAANENSEAGRARPLLELALDEARKIPSVQLEIRTLSQLSAVELRFDASRAESYAEEAVHLARENRLDAWAATGLVRLSSAQSRQRKMKEAEQSVTEGLRLAQESDQLRAVALANLTLANLMTQESRTSEVLGPATASLSFYQKNGFFGSATRASVLLVRAERDRENYSEALKSGNRLLVLSAQAEDPELMRQAEELVGSVLLAMEHYTEALPHFRKAYELSDANSSKGYANRYAAMTLWRMGRSDESDETLRALSADALFARSAQVERGHLLLSEDRYDAALALARKIMRDPAVDAADLQELTGIATLAESHLGLKKEAFAGLEKLKTTVASSDTTEAFEAEVEVAEVSLWLGLGREAEEAAARVAKHYSTSGQLDSAFRSSCLAAAAAKLLRDADEFHHYSTIAVDISRQIQHCFGTPVSQEYFERPDVQALMRSASINIAQGDSHG